MGCSLGFRPPQFSEDSAWLPGWLQQHQAEPFDGHIRKPQTPSEPAFNVWKDFASSQGITNGNKDPHILSREEVRYNNYHLFLSGEDDSPPSSSMSPGNVLHFHLRLSSDGDSRFDTTQWSDTSQKLPLSKKVLSMQLIEHTVGSGEKNHFIMHSRAGLRNTSPLCSIERTVKYVCPPCPSNDKDSKRHHKEKFGFSFLKIADVHEAVEQSITASEALVIHELVKSAVPMESVLEVALRVKKARVENLEDAFQCQTQEADNCDSLLDLDDVDMADAYEDVGLSYSIPYQWYPCDSAVSCIKETPLSNDYCRCDKGMDGLDFRSQQVSFSASSAKRDLEGNVDKDMGVIKELPFKSLNHEGQKKALPFKSLDHEEQKKTLPSKSLGHEGQKKRSHGPVLATNNTSRNEDSMLHQRIQENADGLSMEQAVGIDMLGVTSLQPRTNLISADRFRTSFLARETVNVASETVEMEDTPALLKQKNGKTFNRCFLETSFLSESVDIAPDENSFVQKHDSQSKLGSQSSDPCEGLQDKAHKGLLLSQDMVTSSGLSYIDPLCSVVPCSLSTENASSEVAPNQNDSENDVEKWFRPTPEIGVRSLHRTLDQNIELECGDEQAEHPVHVEKWFRPTPAIGVESLQRTLDQNIELECRDKQAEYPVHVESSKVSTGRQLTSLKTYSMLSPNNVEEGCQHHSRSFHQENDQGLPSFDQEIAFNISSGKRDSTKFPCLRTISKYASSRHNEDNHKTTTKRSSASEMTHQKRKNDEIAEEGEFLVQPLENGTLPLVLNQRMHTKHGTLPEFSAKHQRYSRHQNIRSGLHNSHSQHASIRKQVRFSIVEDQLQQTKNVQKLRSLGQNCSTAAISKRRKVSELQSMANGMKTCLTNSFTKVKRRFIFQGIGFLVTGFSGEKGKEIEGLICRYGGTVLQDIPSPPKSRGKRSSRIIFDDFPVILCTKKLESTKFLYGCAANALILKVDWLTDSIAAGSIIPPDKYMILSKQDHAMHTRTGKLVHLHDNNYIFEKVGIMLHGKHTFCTKYAKVIKHGGGSVFKTLQWLVQSLNNKKIYVGALVAEDESRLSRHLKHCALEREIPIMPASWIIKSLHSGDLLPVKKKNYTSFLPAKSIPHCTFSTEFSEEI